MKNIVFILTDQQHYRTLRANGCPEADTPCLDRLVAEGLNFRNHQVVSPVCSPSRGAIWTGLLPSESGLCANGCALSEGSMTLPKVFGAEGFATAHFGKLHLEPVMSQGLIPRTYGFETCEIGEGDQYLTHDAYNLWLRQREPRAFFAHYHRMGENGHARAYAAELREDLTHSAWVTERACSWLSDRRRDRRPFLLSLGYFDPHHAWNPCEPYASRWALRAVSAPAVASGDLPSKPAHWRGGHGLDPFDLASIIRSYHAMISHVDACVARILGALEASGLLQDTIVVFSSDHGEFLGNHGKLFKGPFLCDDLLRVPMIVWDGARRGAGRAVDGLTSSLDFYATLPELAGFAPPPAPRARRFVDRSLTLFPDGLREHALSEWRAPPVNVGPTGTILSLRLPHERYVRYVNTGEEEYYRHRDDPCELCNLASSPETAARRSELCALLSEISPRSVDCGEVPSAPW